MGNDYYKKRSRKCNNKGNKKKGGLFGYNVSGKLKNAVSTAKNSVSSAANAVQNVVDYARTNKLTTFASNTLSNLKNKSKYIANLVLDTSNVNKIHLKNQFYLQYMDLKTVKRVYSNYRDIQKPQQDTTVEAFIQSINPYEDLQIDIYKAKFRFKYDIYGKQNSKPVIPDATQEEEQAQIEEKEKNVKGLDNEVDNSPVMRAPSTLTGFNMIPLSVGQLNNSVLIEYELYERIEQTLKQKIRDFWGMRFKQSYSIMQPAQKLRNLYRNHLRFNQKYSTLYRFLSSYKYQIQTCMSNPASTVPLHALESINDNIHQLYNNSEVKNDAVLEKARQHYSTRVGVTIRALVSILFLIPFLYSKMKSTLDSSVEGKTSEELLHEELPKDTNPTNVNEPNPVSPVENPGNENEAFRGGDIIDPMNKYYIRLVDYYNIYFSKKGNNDNFDVMLNNNLNEATLSYAYNSAKSAFMNSNSQKGGGISISDNLKDRFYCSEAKYAVIVAINVMQKIVNSEDINEYSRYLFFWFGAQPLVQEMMPTITEYGGKPIKNQNGSLNENVLEQISLTELVSTLSTFEANVKQKIKTYLASPEYQQYKNEQHLKQLEGTKQFVRTVKNNVTFYDTRKQIYNGVSGLYNRIKGPNKGGTKKTKKGGLGIRESISKTVSRVGKIAGNFDYYLRIVDCIFLTVYDDMNHRIRKGLLSMIYDKRPNDEQTGNTMGEDVSNLIATTQKYAFRIPLITGWSPLSLLIEHISFGFVCSPACVASIHVFFIILLKSRFLNKDFSQELLRLMGQVLSKSKVGTSALDLKPENQTAIESLHGKYCNINNNFMGRLNQALYNAETQMYKLDFQVFEYNQEKTELRQTPTVKSVELTEGNVIQEAVPLVFKCPNYYQGNRSAVLRNTRIHTPVRLKNLTNLRTINKEYEREDQYFGNIRQVIKNPGIVVYDNYEIMMNEGQPTKNLKLMKAMQAANRDPPLHEMIPAPPPGTQRTDDTTTCNATPITAVGTLLRAVGVKAKTTPY